MPKKVNQPPFYREAYEEALASGLKPGNARLFALAEAPLRLKAYMDNLTRLVELAEAAMQPEEA